MSTKKEYLWTNWGFLIEENILWLVPHDMNALCKVNLVSKKTEKIIIFPRISIERAGAYSLKKYGDYIVTVPAAENSIYIYNITSDEVVVVPLRREYQELEKFFACCYWNGFVYFLPRYYSNILKLNLSEHTLIDIFSAEYNGLVCDYVQIRQKIYMVNMSGKVVVFNMETETYEHIEICRTESFNAITLYEDEKIVVSNSRGIIYVYDLVSSDVEKVEVIEDGNFGGIICAEDNLYLFPKTDSEKVISFRMKELNTDIIHLENTLSKNNLYDYRWGVFSEPVLEKGIIYVMNACNRCLYMIDIFSNKATKVYLELSEMSQEQCNYFTDFMQTVGGICEGDAPHEAMEYFTTGYRTKIDNENEAVGKKIFGYLKELL